MISLWPTKQTTASAVRRCGDEFSIRQAPGMSTNTRCTRKRGHPGPHESLYHSRTYRWPNPEAK